MRDMTTGDSQMNALIEGTDRASRRPHGSNEIDAMSAAMSDALRDILREEARRDAARKA